MFAKKPQSETLGNLLYQSHAQKRSYVNIYMKWTKEHFYDNIEHIHKARALKPVLALKNWITQSPEKCIPLDSVDKKRLRFEVPVEMPIFLRQYPTIFEEFRTPKYNHPWFRLTPEAAEVDEEEQRVYEDFKEDLRERLRRLILMSPEKVLPLKIVQGMKWYLGLPDDILSDPERKFLDGSFRFVGMGDGIEGLGVSSEGQAVLSYIQRNAIRKGMCSGSEGSGTTDEQVIAFPLFPTQGIRLRKRIKDWLNEFQKLPYLSPYKDYPDLATDTDLSEKRVIAILHELLCLCVHHSAERQKILCLRKYLGLPQKFLRAFERHPFMFYVSTRHRTRTAILKEPFEDPSSIERHPLLSVRRKYMRLMKYSAERVGNRRFRVQTRTRRQWKKSKVTATEESQVSGKFRVRKGVL